MIFQKAVERTRTIALKISCWCQPSIMPMVTVEITPDTSRVSPAI